MKTMFLIATAALALAATPVVAQQKAQTSGQGAQQSQHLPRLFVGPGIIEGNDVYDCTGKYLGSDPDANIRQQLLKEGDPTCTQ